MALASKFDAVAEVVTPPASKAKPSPPTGDKVTKTSKPPSQDPLQLQLQAMQKQLEEQGAQIAAYEKQRAERKSVPKPPSALELQLQAMQKQLEKQGALLQQYRATVDPAVATPSPATKPTPSKSAPKPSKSSPASTNHQALADDEIDKVLEDCGEPIVMPDGTKVISHDALRMRLKRLCSPKASGKSWVSPEMLEDYKAGGAARESLELALVETIRELGTKTSHAKMRVPGLIHNEGYALLL